MNGRISVIIPVYNVAAYLPQCLESVLSQEDSDLEVILIDDGSTDGSGAVCDGYALRDSRVRVIHQKNSGGAAAKNAGLRVASGEYLSFVDSDDYLEPGAYRYMLQVLRTTGADAAQFSFRDIYSNRREDQLLCEQRTILDGKDYLLRFPKDWTCALLWNKLFKRSLFDGVFFEEGHKIDDEYFTYQGFLKPCKMVCDPYIVYNYRRRSSSVMGSSEAAEQRILDCLDAIVKRRAQVSAVYPDLKRAFDESYLDAMWYLSENANGTEKTIRLLKKHLREYLAAKGNLFPPFYLCKGLLALWLLPSERLLKRAKEKEDSLDISELFQ